MQNVEATVVNCTAQPVNNPIHSPNLEQVLHSTAQAFDNAMKNFSDEVPGQETQKEKKAMGFLNGLKDYMQSAGFQKDIKDTAKKYGVPEKQLAQNFFTKALGTVGDILGIAISAVCNAGHMIINLGGTILHGIIDLIRGLANAFASIVTFNQTCHA